MAITGQNEINFANEQQRPLSEQLINLATNLQYTIDLWNGGVSANVPNDSGEILEDGRQDKKVDLTGADMNSIMNTIISVNSTLQTAGVLEQLSKGAIRI